MEIASGTPMNKIVLKPKPSKPDLKNIRPKVNTLENTNHKVKLK